MVNKISQDRLNFFASRDTVYTAAQQPSARPLPSAIREAIPRAIAGEPVIAEKVKEPITEAPRAATSLDEPTTKFSSDPVGTDQALSCCEKVSALFSSFCNRVKVE